MAGTFTCLQYHFIFSTKDRRPIITPDFRSELYNYIGGIVRGQKGVLYGIGGIADHLHLLVRLHQEIKICDFMRDLKSSASGWVHRNYRFKKDFAWQDGYGAFSVSMSQSGRVKKYIEGQEEHHKKRDYKDEFRAFLQAHQIEFDESTIWL